MRFARKKETENVIKDLFTSFSEKPANPLEAFFPPRRQALMSLSLIRLNTILLIIWI